MKKFVMIMTYTARKFTKCFWVLSGVVENELGSKMSPVARTMKLWFSRDLVDIRHQWCLSWAAGLAIRCLFINWASFEYSTYSYQSLIGDMAIQGACHALRSEDLWHGVTIPVGMVAWILPKLYSGILA